AVKHRRTHNSSAGGISSTRYQRAGTLMRAMRENKLRKPVLPSTMRVIRRPDTLGPRSMTGNIIKPANLGTSRPRMSLGATIARAPNQEMAKATAKKELTGKRVATLSLLGGLALATLAIHFFLIALKANASDAQANHRERDQNFPVRCGRFMRTRSNDSQG